MGFIPILIVCSLAVGYVGDRDSGSTCLRFFDRDETTYSTLKECGERLEELSQAVKVNRAWLTNKIPGPYHFKGKCIVPLSEEKGA